MSDTPLAGGEEAIPQAQLTYEVPRNLHPGLALTLGIVGLRLLGVYFLTTAAIWIPQFFYSLTSIFYAKSGGSAGQFPEYLVYYGMQFLIYAVCGWLVVVKAEKLGMRLFGKLPDLQTEGASTLHIATLMVAGIGLCTIIYSIGQSLTYLASFISNRNRSDPILAGRLSTMLFNLSLTTLSTVLQPAVGLYLLLRAQRVAGVGIKHLIK